MSAPSAGKSHLIPFHHHLKDKGADGDGSLQLLKEGSSLGDRGG